MSLRVTDGNRSPPFTVSDGARRQGSTFDTTNDTSYTGTTSIRLYFPVTKKYLYLFCRLKTKLEISSFLICFWVILALLLNTTSYLQQGL